MRFVWFLRIHLIILLTELLTRSVTDAFISSPTDMVMFGHLIRLKAQKAQQEKQQIDKRHRTNNGIIFKQRSIQIECRNPSENELKRLLALAYLKHIDQVFLYK